LHRRNSAPFRYHIRNCAVVVVEGATVTPMHMEPPPCSPSDFFSTSLASASSAGWSSRWQCTPCRFSWRSMPAFGPTTVAPACLAAGGMTLALAQIAFAATQSLFVRAVIAAVFALPATFAGYHVVLAMAQIGVPSVAWQEAFACFGAIFIGGTAWTRLTVFTEPQSMEPGRAVSNSSHPVLTATTREG
jgi:hypothetical protein